MRFVPFRPSASPSGRRDRRAALALACAALITPTMAAGSAQGMSMDGVSTVAPASAMFIVGTPEAPLVTRGPRGPLWTLADDAEMQGIVAPGSVSGAARRFSLTTAAATKKLSKTCQKLLKKRKKGLSKAAKKQRAKCLEQRAKLIKDSKKKAGDKTGGSGTSSPATGAGTPTVPTTGGAAPTPTPKPSAASATPTPTPQPGGGPTATPAPTAVPTPTPAPPAPCVPAASAITVTATSYASPLAITRACAAAGDVTFTYSVTDPVSSHTLYIVAAEPDGTTKDPNATPVSVVAQLTGNSDSRPPKTIPLAAGKYILYCNVPGHGAMQIGFEAQ